MEPLHLKKGNRCLHITCMSNRNKALITCSEYWEPKIQNAVDFFLEPDDIDKIISKLQEAKKFLINYRKLENFL